MTSIYIGIDGGGTHTRAVAVTEDGNILAHSAGAGSNPDFDSAARENTLRVIQQVVEGAACEYADVIALVAGLAGVNRKEDREWAEQHLSPPELSCPRTLVNDAVVAHVGAFRAQPGIIAIAGTGSMVLGINENFDPVRNVNFRHWASCSASYIAYQAMHRLLAAGDENQDQDFLEAVQAHWEVNNFQELLALGARGFLADSRESNIRFSNMAPLVTEAAQAGCTIAQTVCDEAVNSICTGISLVASQVQMKTIPVALHGGVLRSEYIYSQTCRALAHQSGNSLLVVEPAFPAEVGAALMALKNNGVAISNLLLENLAASKES